MHKDLENIYLLIGCIIFTAVMTCPDRVINADKKRLIARILGCILWILLTGAFLFPFKRLLDAGVPIIKLWEAYNLKTVLTLISAIVAPSVLIVPFLINVNTKKHLKYIIIPFLLFAVMILILDWWF